MDKDDFKEWLEKPEIKVITDGLMSLIKHANSQLDAVSRSKVLNQTVLFQMSYLQGKIEAYKDIYEQFVEGEFHNVR